MREIVRENALNIEIGKLSSRLALPRGKWRENLLLLATVAGVSCVVF
jgi:hypothetical protein